MDLSDKIPLIVVQDLIRRGELIETVLIQTANVLGAQFKHGRTHNQLFNKKNCGINHEIQLFKTNKNFC